MYDAFVNLAILHHNDREGFRDALLKEVLEAMQSPKLHNKLPSGDEDMNVELTDLPECKAKANLEENPKTEAVRNS